MRNDPIPGLAIHYDVAQEQMVSEAEQRHRQAVALNEFRNSTADSFDSRDLWHYVNATGKDLKWLIQHARFSHPAGLHGAMLTSAVLDDDSELQDIILQLS